MQATCLRRSIHSIEHASKQMKIKSRPPKLVLFSRRTFVSLFVVRIEHQVSSFRLILPIWPPMPRTTTDEYHALEISEILFLIASHLRPTDPALCCLVNKTWFLSFNPCLWRCVHCKLTSLDWGRQPPEIFQALAKYANHVRELSCCDSNDIPDPCTGLTNLRKYRSPPLQLGEPARYLPS